MKHIILSISLVLSLFASISLGVASSFTEYEKNATLFLVNFYSYKSINDIVQDDTSAINIIRNRSYNQYIDIDVLFGDLNYNYIELNNLRLASHLIDWSSYSNDLGLNKQDTNFLYALTGVLIGFVFLFWFVSLVIKR